MRSLCSADVSLLKYIDLPLLFNTRSCCLLSPRLSSRSCTTNQVVLLTKQAYRLDDGPDNTYPPGTDPDLMSALFLIMRDIALRGRWAKLRI